MFNLLMNPDIQKAVDAGKLTPPAGAALAQLQPGTYVTHKSWGFGQIDSINFLVNQMTIQFKGKKDHSMQLQYAAESLIPIPPDHILAQKASNLPSVKARAKNDPVGLARQILTSFGGKATQDQIAQSLVPDAMTESEFKRWLEATKKALKKDGHYAIPSKKSEPFELREGQISHADEYIAVFNNARQVKDQVAALELILKNLIEFTDPATQLTPLLRSAGDTARKSHRLHTSLALSLLLSRDEIAERAGGLDKGADAPTVADFLQAGERQLPALLSEIPAAKLKRVLSQLPGAFEEQWSAKAIDLALRGNTRIVAEVARLLVEKGKSDELRAALARAISEHSITSEALHWLSKERSGEFRELAGVRLLGAIVSALEREQFGERRDRKLHDLLLSDKELLTDLIEDATPEELRETMRRIMMATVFEELNKRSLLGRIIRQYPDLQSMISGDSTEKQESLVVSWASLEKRKADYEELVNKRIPENIREISIAREHGDLRENFEYKAAKEMQRVLSRRQSETERDLARARGTDFSNPDISKVNIGTKVTLRDLANENVDIYTILGAWDSVPEEGILSYQTAIAQALIGHKVGEKIQLPAEHGERTVEIVSIEAYQAAVLVPA
ncbi:MAG: greA [Chthoniobacteraceae bacterium]|nr:greA [Chthoniobacteraceae bacterium]